MTEQLRASSSESDSICLLLECQYHGRQQAVILIIIKSISRSVNRMDVEPRTFM